jgi:hypothetical protein
LLPGVSPVVGLSVNSLLLPKGNVQHIAPPNDSAITPVISDALKVIDLPFFNQQWSQLGCYPASSTPGHAVLPAQATSRAFLHPVEPPDSGGMGIMVMRLITDTRHRAHDGNGHHLG